MPSLMVSVPTYGGGIKPACAEAIGNAIDVAESAGLLDRVVHRHVGGYGIAHARNIMARSAIDEGVDYLWMVDSDVVVPPCALVHLMSHRAGVAMGWYVRGMSDDGTTCAIRRGCIGFSDSYAAGELVEIGKAAEPVVAVKGNGLGCALFRPQVFQKVPKPWFKFVDHPDGTAMGEDYWFCKQCADARVALYVDARVGCGHIHDRVLEAR